MFNNEKNPFVWVLVAILLMIVLGSLITTIQSMSPIDLSYFKQPITAMTIGDAIIIYVIVKIFWR